MSKGNKPSSYNYKAEIRTAHRSLYSKYLDLHLTCEVYLKILNYSFNGLVICPKLWLSLGSLWPDTSEFPSIFSGGDLGRKFKLILFLQNAYCLVGRIHLTKVTFNAYNNYKHANQVKHLKATKCCSGCKG